MSEEPKAGSISWRDLTTANAKEVADFYAAVADWKIEPSNMGDYDDYGMLNRDGECVAGICHAKGANVNLPPQWLIYITVEDVEAAAKTAWEKGGEIIDGPREMGEGKVVVIKDPAGAVAALYSA